MKLEGISIRQYEGGNFEFTIKADTLIETIQKTKNKRGFIDGIFVKLAKPSEKGVTHLVIANVAEEKISV